MGSSQNKEVKHSPMVTSYGATGVVTVGIRQSYIYVLLLNEDKYYVGRTYDVDRRIKEHTQKSGGAEWTSKYGVVKEMYRKESDNAMDEDKEVESLMIKYGIDSVRGGIYSKIQLDQPTKDLLQKKIWHAQDKCLQCGGIGHYIKDCPSSNTTTKPAVKFTEGESVKFTEGESDKRGRATFVKKEVKEVAKPKRLCTRCGRNSHNVDKCYAKTHLDGKPL